MKLKYSFNFLLLLTIASCSPINQRKNLKSFEWMLGKWERVNENPGQESFEYWEKLSPTNFRGIGFTLKKQDTVFIERLHLQTDQGNIYYIPEVAHNATPIYFKISEYSNTGFTAENPNHDFPKKINYQKTEKGMKAVISGDGKSIDFVFHQIN